MNTETIRAKLKAGQYYQEDEPEIEFLLSETESLKRELSEAREYIEEAKRTASSWYAAAQQAETKLADCEQERDRLREACYQAQIDMGSMAEGKNSPEFEAYLWCEERLRQSLKGGK